MEFIDYALEEYSKQHSTSESEVLYNINRQTHLKTLHPRMLSGHLQGLFLSQISYMIKPRHVLEIGTFTAYSTICLAQGLAEGGFIHTLENNLELEQMIFENINKAGLEEKVKVYFGEALNIIPTIDEIFDLVFIDADKENYINYFVTVIDKVKKGGFIIADNVLWSGKVLKKANANDTETIGIIRFNEYIQKEPQVENLLLPFRDGLMLMRKL